MEEPTVRREPDAFENLIEVLRADFRRLFPHLHEIEADCFRVERDGDSLSGRVWIEYEILRDLRRYRERTTLLIENGRVARRQHEEKAVADEALTRPPDRVPAGKLLDLCVLVADDWPDNADSLGMILRCHVREVHIAYDGEQAKALAERSHLDAAVLDVQMPKVSGLDVAAALASRSGRRPLLVAMSGFLAERDRTAAFSAGFDHFLPKPVDASKLTAILRQHAAGNPADP